MNLQAREVYDPEYGHHMKDEPAQAVEKPRAQDASEKFDLEQSLIKASPFGSFFLLVNNKKKQRERRGISEA